MSKKMLLFLGLSCPAMAQLPAPIHLHRPAPTTQTLRSELLGDERVNSYLVEGDTTRGSWNLSTVSLPGYENDIQSAFRPRQDEYTHLTQEYDFHYLQDLNRVDNPFLHNRQGAWGITF